MFPWISEHVLQRSKLAAWGQNVPPSLNVNARSSELFPWSFSVVLWRSKVVLQESELFQQILSTRRGAPNLLHDAPLSCVKVRAVFADFQCGFADI